jgi:hypothetical protein
MKGVFIMMSTILHQLPLPTAYYPMSDSDSLFAGIRMPDILVTICIVFAVVVVAPLLAKWLLVVCFFRRYQRPAFLKFFTVSLMEISCFVLAFLVAAMFRGPITAVAIYLVLAASSNLVLFRSSVQPNGSRDYGPLKRGLNAFAASLVSGIPYMLVLAAIVAPWVAPFIIPGLL